VTRALNPEQERAARHGRGPALVLAGPGTGKTTTLVARFRYLLDQGVDPTGILVTTFTRKASRELKKRIADECRLDLRGCPVGTFHSVCIKLLGNPDVIHQESQRFNIVRKVSGGRWKADLKDLLDIIDRYKDSMLTPRDALASAKKVKGPQSADHVLAAEIYRSYQHELIDRGLLDYGDLIVRAVDALRGGDPQVTGRAQFRHLLVDEYQDINPAQDALISQLLSRHRDLWVVGDDDQAIYGWRGSNVGFITGFAERYEGAATYRLKRNYRSTPRIVAASAGVVAPNKKRLDKNLKAVRSDGAPVCLHGFALASEEASWIVQSIQKLLDHGTRLGEIAVLMRVNALSAELESRLGRAKIPFVIQGGGSFWELPPVRAVLAALWGAEDALRQSVPPWRAPDFQRSALNSLATAGRADGVQRLVRSLAAKLREGFPRSLGWETRIQWETALDQLIEEAVDQRDMVTFLTNCRAGAAAARAHDTREAVTLSTIHGAKGLEWDAVFVCAFEEDFLPHRLNEDEAEERRLAYVAVSRARDYLAVSWSETRAGRESWPSPFLRDLLDGVSEDGDVDSRGLRPRWRPDKTLRQKVGGERSGGRDKRRSPTTTVRHPAKRPRQKVGGERRRRRGKRRSPTTKVRHPVFGLGRVVNINSQDSSYRVEFESCGTKDVPSRDVEIVPNKGT